jgi:subtilase family serine protease
MRAVKKIRQCLANSILRQGWAVALALLFVSTTQAADRQVIPGHVPSAVARLTPVAHLTTPGPLHLTISLPLRNRESLTNLLSQLYDPASPSFHHFLTPDQFTAAFAPAEQDYQTVVDYARANGFTILSTPSTRALVEVNASVADIEKAFHVNLRVYPHPTEHRNFYSPDVEPSLDLITPVLSIAGLNNYLIPHPSSLHAMRPPARSNATPNGGSEIESSYIGQDFRNAYVPGLPLTGTGQSIGLVEFDSYYSTDVTDYITDSKSGLTNTSVTISNVISGNVGTPGDGNVEVSLDIDMAISMAPGLSTVYVYEAPNDSSYADIILDRMATNTTCLQLSSSWSGFNDSGVNQAFLKFAAQGQSFFEASGDSGAYFPAGNPVESPCDNPNITVVGGTTLSTTGPKGNWVSEITWNWYTTQIYTTANATCGGISPTYAIPSWQQGISMTASLGSTNYRNIPDVALVADAIFIIADDGVDYIAGGTSAATPLWAGMNALINQQRTAFGQSPVGFINPAIYALGKGTNYTTCFHDITVGNNTNFNSESDTNINNSSYTENFVNTNLFPAVPGYDLCTGWGSPVGSNLIAALAPPPGFVITPLTGFAERAPYGGPFSAIAQTYTLTNAESVSITWYVGALPSWLTASTSGGILAPAQSTSLTISLNTAAAASLPAGTYSTNISITNTPDGITQERFFSVTVSSTQLVQNGGFEDGNFTDWSLTGPADVSKDNLIASPLTRSVFPRGTSSVTTAAYIYSGTYSALFGEISADAFLSQSLSTVPGQSYLISFWLANSGLLSGDAVTPNSVELLWNGATLYAQTNLAAFTWTNLQFLATASSAATTLEFGLRNDNDYFALDNVTVQAITAPSFTSAAWNNGTVTLTWNGLAGYEYQLQYATNLPIVNWVNLGVYIIPTTGRITAVDISPPDSQRFYRIILQLP